MLKLIPPVSSFIVATGNCTAKCVSPIILLLAGVQWALHPNPASLLFLLHVPLILALSGHQYYLASLPPVHLHLISMFFSSPEDRPLQCLQVDFYQNYICLYLEESKSP